MRYANCILVILALGVLSSCGRNRPAFERVNLGETEAEVVAKLGAPSGTMLMVCSSAREVPKGVMLKKGPAFIVPLSIASLNNPTSHAEPASG